MEDVRTLVKTANCIRQVLWELQKHRYLVSLDRLANLVKQFKGLGLEARKLGLALARDWLPAADRCCRGANRFLNEIPYAVSQIKQLTEEPCPEVPKLAFLVEELKQVQQEFGDVYMGEENSSIFVETDPIELDGVYLGPFRIELHLNKLCELYRGSPYCVIALDPHPAATADDITHPHVSDERLCEGDGTGAVRAALEQGRLCDFFCIVRSILGTYNADSAHVPLDEWDGTPCYSCGYVASREDSYYCTFCERDYCEACSTCCCLCSETVCDGCATRCKSCEELVCPNCVRTCAECESVLCSSCLEEDVCPDCRQEESNYETEETKAEREPEHDTDATAIGENRPANLAGTHQCAFPAGSEVQPDGVGQAAVLQGQDG